jgi:hypothetical protein
MNRVILIGNGFDLAHGLKTSYNDFIDDFWDRERQKILSTTDKNYNVDSFIYEDEYIVLKTNYFKSDLLKTLQNYSVTGYKWYKNISTLFEEPSFHALNNKPEILCKNDILDIISKKNSSQNWVDIEEEYYSALVECQRTNGDIKKLNNDFYYIQGELQKYLLEQNEVKFKENLIIKDKFYADFSKDDFIQLPSIVKVDKVLFLNFNYTSTLIPYTYGAYDTKVINIHGELKNKANQIIFGYGDEQDDNYKIIENMKNNDYLKYFKSSNYSLNNNHRNMVNFINETEYQIYIMGLSCGTSDRTLLNKLFEHNNCKSIKIFYFKKDIDIDNYRDIYMNISRIFTDKDKMRELVASKENSLPLPQGL